MVQFSTIETISGWSYYLVFVFLAITRIKQTKQKKTSAANSLAADGL